MKPLYIVLLLLVAFSFGYFVSWKLNGKEIKMKTVVTTAMQETCPFVLHKSFPKQYIDANTVGEVTITYPPVLITPQPTGTIIDTTFDPKQKDVWDNWVSSFDYTATGSPWKEQDADVDGDGKNEKILTANIAMNHTPNIVEIVKNNRIIFETDGANIALTPANNNNGFFLNETLDWDAGVYQRTRYIYSKGKFIPVWIQKSCAVVNK